VAGRNVAYEEKLSAIEALRNAGATAETEAALRKALGDRNNYIVAKAAGVACALGMSGLVPEMLTAYDRFFSNAVKTDPQCWAKNALSKAMAELGHTEAATYLHGLAHVQLEPVWEGRADSAATLRAQCAIALVECRDIGDVDLLQHLADALVDEEKLVRAEAARAIGLLNRREGAVVLRLYAHRGDKEPEVIGACFSAMLSINLAGNVAFVAGFLERPGDEAAEAALALGLTHDARAFEILKARLGREAMPRRRGSLITAISLTRLPEALEMLVGLVEAGTGDAGAAREALSALRLPEELQRRVDGAGR